MLTTSLTGHNAGNLIRWVVEVNKISLTFAAEGGGGRRKSLVPDMGLEPTRLVALDPKSSVATNYTNPA